MQTVTIINIIFSKLKTNSFAAYDDSLIAVFFIPSHVKVGGLISQK